MSEQKKARVNYTTEQKEEALKLLLAGKTQKEVAELTGIGLGTIGKLLPKDKAVETEPSNKITNEMERARLNEIILQIEELERRYNEDMPKLKKTRELYQQIVDNQL